MTRSIHNLYSDEEKRKMCHSSSIKNLLKHSVNSDEEQVHELMTSLLDTIDKEYNTEAVDTSCMLFNASASAHRYASPAQQLVENDDLCYSLDGHKHSSGILISENDVPSRTEFFRIDLIDFRYLVVLDGYQLENCIPVEEFSKRFGEIDSKENKMMFDLKILFVC